MMAHVLFVLLIAQAEWEPWPGPSTPPTEPTPYPAPYPAPSPS